MHSKNAFITLTYDDDHLKSSKLVYSDFQKFMKKLRKLQNEPMGVFVTGEYGDKTKRPHWHAIIFNWQPSDLRYFRKNERGDRIYDSAITRDIWGKGNIEVGSVTFQSAGYCARYAAKKLAHGKDQEHDFHPISKKSSKHAIGKKFLEKYWPDVFTFGHIVLPDGGTCSVPRYYEKWFKENHPSLWVRYVTEVKSQKIQFAEKKSAAEAAVYQECVHARRLLSLSTGRYRGDPATRLEARKAILRAKFQLLQGHLKL